MAFLKYGVYRIPVSDNIAECVKKLVYDFLDRMKNISVNTRMPVFYLTTLLYMRQIANEKLADYNTEDLVFCIEKMTQAQERKRQSKRTETGGKICDSGNGTERDSCKKGKFE